MNVRSAFTFSYCTDLTSAVMRTNNQSKGFAVMQSLLLCPKNERKNPINILTLEKNSPRNACKQISGL